MGGYLAIGPAAGAPQNRPSSVQIGAGHLQRPPGDELQYFVNFRAAGSGRVASTLTRSTAAADGPPRTAVRGCVPDADDIRCARRHMIPGRRGRGRSASSRSAGTCEGRDL
jgi:hypothetical protein